MPKKSGFTLIELLVTISIIAILSAIGLVVYSSVLKQGRDSKRQSDLRSIQSALEQYNSDQFFYPANLSFGNPLNNCTGNPTVPCSSTKIYMNKIPNDSNVSTPYRYTALRNGSTGCTNATTTTQCNSYCLMAKLDIPPSPTLTFPTGCTPGTNNFFVTPP